jgi:hypothetical protein
MNPAEQKASVLSPTLLLRQLGVRLEIVPITALFAAAICRRRVS